MKIEQTLSQSSITNKRKCQGFESSGSSQASEKGVILHQMFSDEPLEFQDGKMGASYRGNFQPFKFEHNLGELKASADKFKKDHPRWFNTKIEKDWQYEIQINQTFNYMDLEIENLSGILDRLMITGDTATIADFKTGRGVVDLNSIESVFQAILYAYLVFTEFPKVQNLTFYWIYTGLGGKTKQMPFSRSDIDFIKTQIYLNAVLTQKVGYNQSYACNYCQRAGNCPLNDKDLYEFSTGDKEADYKKISQMETSLKKKKEKIKKEYTGESEYWSKSKRYYINTESLTPEQFLQIKEDLNNLSLSKELVEKHKDLNLDLVCKETKKFKGVK